MGWKELDKRVGLRLGWKPKLRFFAYCLLIPFLTPNFLLLLLFSLSRISSNSCATTRTSSHIAMSLRPSSRTEVRKKAYKIGVDAEEARRRREDNLVEIRKSKREDNLLKKRREGLLNGIYPQQPPLFPSDPSQSPAAVEKKVCICLFLFIFF